jgi:nicotinate-nucleotide pyrophosphorylase (carboxylating)
MQLDKSRVLPIVKAALKEDIGAGDITTNALIDKFTSARATIVAKDECVVCGLRIAEWAMAQVDYSVRFKPNCSDGDKCGKGKDIAFLEGHASSILKAERTILNFLSFLSGIATRTRRFVDKASPYGVKVMDTRKTLPLLRYHEKYAVSVGGGSNHRMGLYDQALIKDNHIGVQRKAYSAQQKKDFSLKAVVENCRKKVQKGTTVEIEVTSPEEFGDAIQGKPDIIMLDNMSARDVKACVEIRRLARFKPLIEVSGGITLDNIEEYAKMKVDMISVGSLTNSVDSIDMSLELV